ncbi:hypothetical protein G6F22_017164 [Rhizopus arrhizus]|nr:hypothetical protein G6F22_017164 [Rhizopus arrhizus]
MHLHRHHRHQARLPDHPWLGQRAAQTGAGSSPAYPLRHGPAARARRGQPPQFHRGRGGSPQSRPPPPVLAGSAAATAAGETAATAAAVPATQAAATRRPVDLRSRGPAARAHGSPDATADRSTRRWRHRGPAAGIDAHSAAGGRPARPRRLRPARCAAARAASGRPARRRGSASLCASWGGPAVPGSAYAPAASQDRCRRGCRSCRMPRRRSHAVHRGHDR